MPKSRTELLRHGIRLFDLERDRGGLDEKLKECVRIQDEISNLDGASRLHQVNYLKNWFFEKYNLEAVLYLYRDHWKIFRVIYAGLMDLRLMAFIIALPFLYPLLSQHTDLPGVLDNDGFLAGLYLGLIHLGLYAGIGWFVLKRLWNLVWNRDPSASGRSRLKIPRLEMFLPRISAVAVGFLITVMAASDEAWALNLNMGSLQIGATIVVALTIAYLYMRFEVSKHTELGGREVGRRAMKILSVCLAQVFAVALFYSSLLARTMGTGRTEAGGLSYFEGHGGKYLFGFLPKIMEVPLSDLIPFLKVDTVFLIYPQVVLNWTVMALFLGIFLQTLWSAEKMTDEL